MSTMTNEQLKFMSQMTPMNLMMLKPKKRAARLPVNNVTSYRRHAAARTIQNAAKKYLGRKASQSGRGPTPRSPATLAREANIGVMGGARRSSGPTNNTRVTWARRANGTINRFKTLTNLNLTLTKAQRNTLSEMSENKAMNTIRQLSRKK
jgi:hypothetical protein